MSSNKKRKERKRKAQGKKIIAERRARLQKKNRGKLQARQKIKVPQEKTILLLFLLFLSLLVLLPLISITVKDLTKEDLTKDKSDQKTTLAIKEELRRSLPGAFWLKPEKGQEVRLEKIMQNNTEIISLAYLNKKAQKVNSASAFTFLLRNQKVAEATMAEEEFTKNSQDVWQRGEILFFISKEEGRREFYLLNKKEQTVALLLNASGNNEEEAARSLFARLEILDLEKK